MKEQVVSNAVDAAAPVAEIAHHDTLWSNPENWLIVSFTIFITLILRYGVPKIAQILDARAVTIRTQLEQASRLRAEAQALLTSYQQEQELLLKQAEEIVATAKRDAALLRTTAADELKSALERRSVQAQEKIARAEKEAISHIRTHIIESATDGARAILTKEAQSSSDEVAIARAIATIEQQLH